MHIEWAINKDRGNLRPTLSYRVRLEEHEKALALPQVRVTSTIPRPEEHHTRYCYPGTMERAEGWKPGSSTPSRHPRTSATRFCTR